MAQKYFEYSRELHNIIFSVTEKDMKGTECRLNLIKFTAIMHQHCDTPEGRNLYSLLISLVELQKLAYADESSRTQRTILRAYNQSFKFATYYMKLFGDADKLKTSFRSMFGVPFHNISVHLPETLRLVNGKSIMAEAAERHFNKLR